MDWLLLEGLSADNRREVLKSTRRRVFMRNEVVFHEGDPGDTLHLITKGRFAVRVGTALGDLATLTVLGVGDVFGELALISEDHVRTATVIALEDFRAENGATRVVPGSHRWTLLPITGLAGDMDAIRNVLNDEQWQTFQNPVAVELRAGEAVFHHPLTVHGSHFTTTQDYLKAILARQRRKPVSKQLEVETYTWSVLPEAERQGDLAAEITMEMEWVRRELAA